MSQPIKRSRARSTGTLVEVWRSEDFGDEQTAPYITVCEHSSLCEHDTRALAVAWAAEPQMWCENGCQEAFEAKAKSTPTMDVWCPHCGAQPNNPCRMVAGHRYSYGRTIASIHKRRVRS